MRAGPSDLRFCFAYQGAAIAGGGPFPAWPRLARAPGLAPA